MTPLPSDTAAHPTPAPVALVSAGLERSLLDDRAEIHLGAGCVIGNYARIYSHTHQKDDYDKVIFAATSIGARARVGTHTVVLAGTQMADGTIVVVDAAGALVGVREGLVAYRVQLGDPGVDPDDRLRVATTMTRSRGPQRRSSASSSVTAPATGVTSTALTSRSSTAAK